MAAAFRVFGHELQYVEAGRREQGAILVGVETRVEQVLAVHGAEFRVLLRPGGEQQRRRLVEVPVRMAPNPAAHVSMHAGLRALYYPYKMLLSTVRMVRAAAPSLRQSGRGRIVVVASTSVKQPIPNLLLSNSIRLAVVGLTVAQLVGCCTGRSAGFVPLRILST